MKKPQKIVWVMIDEDNEYHVAPTKNEANELKTELKKDYGMKDVVGPYKYLLGCSK